MTRKLIVAALIAATQALAGPTALAQARPGAIPAFDLQAHRGGRALLPENTLPAFANALDIGVHTLELDIAITRDGVPFISHNPAPSPDITRGPDGKYLEATGAPFFTMAAGDVERLDVGRIRPGTAYSRDFADQKPLDGTRIPRLADLFALVRKSGNTDVRFAIETKVTPQAPNETLPPAEFARAVIAAIRDAGMESRSAILSFDWRTLQVVQKEAPGIPTVYITIQTRGMDTIMADVAMPSPWTAGFQYKDHGSVPRMIKAAGGHTWSCFWGNLTPAKVKEAHELGLKVLAWTVNDAPRMNQMMDMGVDGVVTDRPDLLRQEMQRRGLAVPKPTPVAP